MMSIGLAKADIGETALRRAIRCNLEGLRREVHANNFAVADESGQ